MSVCLSTTALLSLVMMDVCLGFTCECVFVDNGVIIFGRDAALSVQNFIIEPDSNGSSNSNSSSSSSSTGISSSSSSSSSSTLNLRG